jgi:hypothetical protein
MERHYTNGTEPDVLPHWECHGPCEQGRLPCPTPEACELSEVDRADRLLVLMVVAAAVVTTVVLGLLL